MTTDTQTRDEQWAAARGYTVEPSAFPGERAWNVIGPDGEPMSSLPCPSREQVVDEAIGYAEGADDDVNG